MAGYKERFSIFVALFICFLLFQCGNNNRDYQTKYSLTQLQEDYNYLTNLIAERHPHFFTDLNELHEIIDRQYALLNDSMTIMEFFRVISPVVGAVKCGHTRIWLPGTISRYSYENSNYLPLDIKVIDDTLFIYKNITIESSIIPGCIIYSLNGKSSQNIIRTMKSGMYADGDNETYKYYRMNGRFTRLYHNLIDDPDSFLISFANPQSGLDYESTITAKSLSEIDSLKKLPDGEKLNENLIDTSFSEDGGRAILKIRFFDFYDNLEDFTGLIDDFFGRLSEREVKNLILDLRGNDGGDPYSATYLLRHLINKPFRYFSHRSIGFYNDLKSHQEISDNLFTGNLFILVDGGCYSTTGHICSLLKYHKAGIFIGEETGGSYACNGAYKEFTLKNTGINLLLPHGVFITDVNGLTKGRGIMPDYSVQPSIEDIVNKKDVVLERALSLIIE